MKAKFVNESLNEDFENEDYGREEDTSVADSYYDVEDEDEMEEEPSAAPFDMMAGGYDEDEDETFVQDELEAALNNELEVPEYSRREVSFRVRGENGVIDAVPMAKMRDGSFLMKVDGKYRKFKLSDIVEESFKGKR